MLADPSSVASSVSAGRDRRSHSCEIGESTEDGSCSRSSRSSPCEVEMLVKGVVVPVPDLGGLRDRSRKSRSCSTDRSRSRGRKRSCRDSSCSPSARVRSRQSQSRSLDRYWSHRVRSRSRNDRSRSRRLHSHLSGCRGGLA